MNLIALESFRRRNRAADKIRRQFVRYRERSNLLMDVHRFVAKMRLLRKLLVGKVRRMKVEGLNRYRGQVREMKEEEKRVSVRKQEEVERKRS